MSQLTDLINTRFDASDKTLTMKRTYWDEAESIFHTILSDAVSSTKKSKNFDPKLPTYLLERSNRVMAQLATGKYKAIDKDDMFSSKIMNLIVDKYVVPNAVAQFPFLIKLRMMDLYSQIYGNYFSLVDWDIKRNGYVGPDMWLINIRNVFPQAGSISLNDSDFIIIRQRQPISYFKNLDKNKYKNLDKIISQLEDKTGSQKRSEDQGKRETSQYPSTEGTKGDGYYDILSMYERDRWVDYVPDAQDDGVLRDIANPQDDGELPIVCKYAIPLIDDYFGMSKMEQGMPMQKTVNSLWNLYLDSVRYSIFPPIMFNKTEIIPSSIKWGAAAKWMTKGSPSNAFTPVTLSPQGTTTFQTVYNTAVASLQNTMGTTETTTSTTTDSTFGKTPQALQMQQARENTGDNADRFYMEMCVTDVMKKFANLIVKRQSSKIQIRMFKSEIKELSAQYPDVNIDDIFDQKSGKLTIDKKTTGSTLYDYEIVSGSTYLVDQQKQMQNLQAWLQEYVQAAQLFDQKFAEQKKKLDFVEINKRLFVNGGIQDWDKIITDIPQEQLDAQGMQQDKMQMDQVLQSIGIGAIPPTPTSGQQQLPVNSFNGGQQSSATSQSIPAVQ